MQTGSKSITLIILFLIVFCAGLLAGWHLKTPKIVTVRKVVMMVDQGEGIGIPMEIVWNAQKINN